MSKVTVKESPAEVAAKEESNVLVDAKGRRIVMRELDALEESRLIFAIGTERAMNPAYVQAYAIPTASVAEIDGEPYSVPQSISQLEGMIKILGRSGLDAVCRKMYATTESEDSAEKEAVKN